MQMQHLVGHDMPLLDVGAVFDINNRIVLVVVLIIAVNCCIEHSPEIVIISVGESCNLLLCPPFNS